MSTTTTRRQKSSNGQKAAPRRLRTDADAKSIERDLEELEVMDEARRIAREHGVLARDLLGASRLPKAVEARDALIVFLKKRFRYSTTEVGRLLKMDHTTVLESNRRTEARKEGKDWKKSRKSTS